jgi:hypothetical protein
MHCSGRGQEYGDALLGARGPCHNAPRNVPKVTGGRRQTPVVRAEASEESDRYGAGAELIAEFHAAGRHTAGCAGQVELAFTLFRNCVCCVPRSPSGGAALAVHATGPVKVTLSPTCLATGWHGRMQEHASLLPCQHGVSAFAAGRNRCSAEHFRVVPIPDLLGR